VQETLFVTRGELGSLPNLRKLIQKKTRRPCS